MKDQELHSPWPFILSLGLAATLLALVAKIFLLGVFGAAILLISILGWMRESMQEKFIGMDDPEAERWPFINVEKVKLGVWIFLASEIVFFGAIIASYLMLRLKSPEWSSTGEVLSISHGTLNTIILLSSSFTLAMSLAYIRKGEQTKLRMGLIITFILGASFLFIKLSEWRELLGHNFNPQSGLHATTYYFTTGIHGIHVLAGLVVLLYLIVKAFRNGYSAKEHTSIDNFGLYWHFVDIIWVILFPIFYLIS